MLFSLDMMRSRVRFPPTATSSGGGGGSNRLYLVYMKFCMKCVCQNWNRFGRAVNCQHTSTQRCKLPENETENYRHRERERGMNAIRFQFMCADKKITIIGINNNRPNCENWPEGIFRAINEKTSLRRKTSASRFSQNQFTFFRLRRLVALVTVRSADENTIITVQFQFICDIFSRRSNRTGVSKRPTLGTIIITKREKRCKNNWRSSH